MIRSERQANEYLAAQAVEKQTAWLKPAKNAARFQKVSLLKRIINALCAKGK